MGVAVRLEGCGLWLGYCVVYCPVATPPLQVLQRGVEEARHGGGPGEVPRLPDCKAAAFGLTQLLREQLYRPGPLGGRLFSLLRDLLQQVYSQPCSNPTICVMTINVSWREGWGAGRLGGTHSLSSIH